MYINKISIIINIKKNVSRFFDTLVLIAQAVLLTKRSTVIRFKLYRNTITVFYLLRVKHVNIHEKKT